MVGAPHNTNGSDPERGLVAVARRDIENEQCYSVDSPADADQQRNETCPTDPPTADTVQLNLASGPVDIKVTDD
jgi:hypothetical protein